VTSATRIRVIWRSSRRCNYLLRGNSKLHVGHVDDGFDVKGHQCRRRDSTVTTRAIAGRSNRLEKKSLEPELFSAVARSATPLRQFGTLYQLIWLIILTRCFCLVLDAASKRTSTNFHSRPSHKRCPRPWFVSLNWHNRVTSCMIDWLNELFCRSQGPFTLRVILSPTGPSLWNSLLPELNHALLIVGQFSSRPKTEKHLYTQLLHSRHNCCIIILR